MADAVRELLEQQIPELHDLVASGIFSDAEVKRIVAKRRKFECVIQQLPITLIQLVRVPPVGWYD